MGSPNHRIGRPAANGAWRNDGEMEYTGVSIPVEQRDRLRELRDDLGFESYALLFAALIENAQEDFSNG